MFCLSNLFTEFTEKLKYFGDERWLIHMISFAVWKKKKKSDGKLHPQEWFLMDNSFRVLPNGSCFEICMCLNIPGNLIFSLRCLVQQDIHFEKWDWTKSRWCVYIINKRANRKYYGDRVVKTSMNYWPFAKWTCIYQDAKVQS